MLCFDKLTGEHNSKNIFKYFILWEYIFKVDHVNINIHLNKGVPPES